MMKMLGYGITQKLWSTRTMLPARRANPDDDEDVGPTSDRVRDALTREAHAVHV
jgi:hypothetical protein